MGFCLRFLCLIVLHTVSADDDPMACESELATMKAKLEKANSAINLDLDPFDLAPSNKNDKKVESDAEVSENPNAIGAPHWPGKSSEYIPPIAMYKNELIAWLKDVQPQWKPAAGALFFGLVNVINGPASFRTMVMLGVSLLAGGSAKYEVALVWPDMTMMQQLIVAVEVGLVVAYVLHKSFDGVRIVLGLLLGVTVSVLLEPFMHTEFWPLNASVIWYSCFAIAGVFLGYTSYNRNVLALLQPFLGGFLCASAVGFLVKNLMEGSFHPPAGPAKPEPQWAELRGACWIDFCSELIYGSNTAGIFKPYAPSAGYVINFDRWAGLFVWFMCFALGAKRQWRLANENTEEEILSLKQSLIGAVPAKEKDTLWGA